MATEHTYRTVLATLIIVFAWAFAAVALARETAPQGPVWLWSEAAPKSASAAQAFSEGDMGRGIRLSKTALKMADSQHGRFIAHHNMCIAFSAQGLTGKAERHCQQSRFLAASNFKVVGVDQGEHATDVLDRNLRMINYTRFGD